MEFIRTLLEQQPLMALFLTIAIGYLVGEINIKGFSLGVGAVLFVALGMGWFAPKAVPAAMVGTLADTHEVRSRSNPAPLAFVRVERTVALISTSTFGRRYEARPRIDVVQGSTTSHASARLFP